MDWFRLKHTLRLASILSAPKRADYIREKNIFHHMGKNCMVMFRKLPLYPQLISFQDNVWVASNVTFYTHDVIHCVLNNKVGEPLYTEHVGCIDVRENVFIGANTTILPNVRIGANTIIGAGSVVNRDIPGNGVYVGVPAKYVCSMEDYINKRVNIPLTRGPKGLSDQTEDYCWKRFEKQRCTGNEENK